MGEDLEGEWLIMVLYVSFVFVDVEVWMGEVSFVVVKIVEGEIGFMSGYELVLVIFVEG